MLLCMQYYGVFDTKFILPRRFRILLQFAGWIIGNGVWMNNWADECYMKGIFCISNINVILMSANVSTRYTSVLIDICYQPLQFVYFIYALSMSWIWICIFRAKWLTTPICQGDFFSNPQHTYTQAWVNIIGPHRILVMAFGICSGIWYCSIIVCNAIRFSVIVNKN